MKFRNLSIISLALVMTSMAFGQVSGGGDGGGSGSGSSGSNSGVGNINNAGVTQRNGFNITVIATGEDSVTIPVIKNGSLDSDTYTKDWVTGVIKKNGDLPGQSGGFQMQWTWPTCSWQNMPAAASGHCSSTGTVKYKFTWSGTGPAPSSIWVACSGFAEASASGTSSQSGSGSNGLGDPWTLGGSSTGFWGDAFGVHLKKVSITQSSNGSYEGEYTISVTASGEASGTTGNVWVYTSCGALPDTRAITFKINGAIPGVKVENLGNPLTDSYSGNVITGEDKTYYKLIQNSNGDWVYDTTSFQLSNLPKYTPTHFDESCPSTRVEPPTVEMNSPVDITADLRVSFPMQEKIYDWRSPNSGTNGAIVTGSDKVNLLGSMWWTNDVHSVLSGSLDFIGISTAYGAQNGYQNLLSLNKDVRTNCVHTSITREQSPANDGTMIDVSRQEQHDECDDPGSLKSEISWDDGMVGKLDIKVRHLPCTETVALSSHDCFTSKYSDLEYVEWNDDQKHPTKGQLPPMGWKIKSAVESIVWVSSLVFPELKVFAAMLSGIKIAADVFSKYEPEEISRPSSKPTYYRYHFNDPTFEPAAGALYNTWWSMSRSYTTTVKFSYTDVYGPQGYQERAISKQEVKGSGVVTIYDLAKDKPLGI